LISVKETKKPKRPVKISVITNPIRVKTKISSFPILNSVEKIIIEVSSLVPKPAKLIGTNPAAFATGNNNKKYRYGILIFIAYIIIYS
jgi:hypothetical protein